MNMYHLIHSVIKLAEVKMFKLEAFHFFENYMTSWNLKYFWYFLCFRRGKEKIVAKGTYDSKKWAADYIEVRGNFMCPRLSAGGSRYRHVGES